MKRIALILAVSSVLFAAGSLKAADDDKTEKPEESRSITYADPVQWGPMLNDREHRTRYEVSDNPVPADKATTLIRKALDSQIDLELNTTTTFEELIGMIQDRFPEMNVALDPKAGVKLHSAIAEEPVRYHGIKLRSVLRLVLSEHDMSYVVRNEVLLLTTEDLARKYSGYVTPSGYPTSDLVVDPPVEKTKETIELQKYHAKKPKKRAATRGRRPWTKRVCR